MKSMTTVITALVLLLLNVKALASWDDIKLTDDGVYFTATTSARFNNSMLAFYMDPQNYCSLKAKNVFGPPTTVSDTEATPIKLKMRIDKGEIHYIEGVTWNKSNLTNYYWDVSIYLKELIDGGRMIFSTANQTDLLTDEFSLVGSRDIIRELYSRCKNAVDWGTSPEDSDWET